MLQNDSAEPARMEKRERRGIETEKMIMKMKKMGKMRTKHGEEGRWKEKESRIKEKKIGAKKEHDVASFSTSSKRLMTTEQFI